MVSFNYTIKDELGIHARPAGILIKAIKDFTCSAEIEKDGKKADAKKLFALLGLGVKCGDTVTMSFDGDDEKDACAKMLETFQSNM